LAGRRKHSWFVLDLLFFSVPVFYILSQAVWQGVLLGASEIEIAGHDQPVQQ